MSTKGQPPKPGDPAARQAGFRHRNLPLLLGVVVIAAVPGFSTFAL